MAKKNKRLYLNSELIVAGIAIGIIIGAFLVVYGDAGNPRLSEFDNSDAVAKIAAVKTDGGGIVGEVSIRIIDGTGKILVTTEPFAEFDTQQSVQFASKAAEKLTGKSLENKDLLVSFRISSGGDSPDAIGGPSAGVSLGVAIAAAMEGLTVADDVVMTGTIDENGNVGRVGGVPDKAKAAADSGASLFIAPEGSGSVEYYQKISKTFEKNGFVVQKVDYVPKITTLDEYVEQFDMDAIEVSNLKEAFVNAVVEKDIAEQIVDESSSRVFAAPAIANYEGCIYQ